MSRAWVGLGSNLQDPQNQLRQAFSELEALRGSRLLARSYLYRSQPMGPA
ncbi:MAG TPA: 2-amino-4-hydroxy-6-hydroxymethyldihydropteridine diphosphokinase, partial [Chromatiaceae bacterium]|nr:2-amino-4-hydroxy-6-hydroxymethyldihydropteridine diphosphokinase [Chromatiaceae bacterium]